jgi:hypothetical protein
MTIGTGAYRHRGNRDVWCTRTRCPRRWSSQPGTVVPTRCRRRIRPPGPRGASGKRLEDWDHRRRRISVPGYRDRRVVHPHTVPSPVALAAWDGGPSPLSAPHPPPGTPRRVREEIGGLGPSAPAHIGTGAPGQTCGAPAHDALACGPRSLGRWSQPAFGTTSAPRDPEARLGRDWRAGTIGTGAYRYRGTGFVIPPGWLPGRGRCRPIVN